MPSRALDAESIMSWALAFAVLVGVTMCLRAITVDMSARVGQPAVASQLTAPSVVTNN